mgnify:CR=1 FL=1
MYIFLIHCDPLMSSYCAINSCHRRRCGVEMATDSAHDRAAAFS